MVAPTGIVLSNNTGTERSEVLSFTPTESTSLAEYDVSLATLMPKEATQAVNISYSRTRKRNDVAPIINEAVAAIRQSTPFEFLSGSAGFTYLTMYSATSEDWKIPNVHWTDFKIRDSCGSASGGISVFSSVGISEDVWVELLENKKGLGGHVFLSYTWLDKRPPYDWTPSWCQTHRSDPSCRNKPPDGFA